VSGKMATAFFVHPLEIAVPEQAHAAGKSGSFAGARRVDTTVRSETAHTITIQTQVAELPSIPEKEKRYSRKPGFTDTRLRPLARRREITAWPLLVFIRVRNPCVFER
jgi:hypothetical protein